MSITLPRIVFVLGKGGVGRSTVAAALGTELARRGKRTCVFGWTVTDPISPWFGFPPADLAPQEVAPRLHVANYRLDETLELYFAKHLGLPRFYRHVIDSVHIRKLIQAAPGIAEVFFIGHLWWLTTLAATESDLHFDCIVVDAPATGHGASLLDVPSVLASLRATGLVSVETARVVQMMADPKWTGALVVTLADELSSEETAELVPRIKQRLARPPLVALVNRSVPRAVGSHLETTGATLRERFSPSARAGVDTVVTELRARVRIESALRDALEGATTHGVVSLEEQLMMAEDYEPRAVVRALASGLSAWLGDES
ncbi:MAG: ArsA-related P-loop ATPase [Polyangiaceae bacterium]